LAAAPLVALAALPLVLHTADAQASATLPAGCASANGTVTCTYSLTGTAQTFTVPAGVTEVTFTASGAGGAASLPKPDGESTSGGGGAIISSDVSTQPGAVFTLNVGGSATNDANLCAGTVKCKGGYNGGANGGSDTAGLSGGGGGGASDVTDDTDTRILIAGGGGGAGASSADANGGAGGYTELPGNDGDGNGGNPELSGGGGGGAGTQTGAGLGGSQIGTNSDGADAVDATGGAGALQSGGGGGGGYFGGGGGGAGAIDHSQNNLTSGGGGGGGGSSFSATGTTPIVTNFNYLDGIITVSFTPPAATLSTQTSAAVTLGESITDTATLSGGSSPTGQVRFDVFGPDNATCTGTPVFTSTDALSTDTNGRTATSESYTPTSAGTYQFVAHYLGDATNSAVDGACTDSNESVIVSPSSGSSSSDSPSPSSSASGSPTPGSPSTSNGGTVPPVITATPRRLASTGSSLLPLIIGGAGALALGVEFCVASRRRKPRHVR
jgi:hypothetical protein